MLPRSSWSPLLQYGHVLVIACLLDSQKTLFYQHHRLNIHTGDFFHLFRAVLSLARITLLPEGSQGHHLRVADQRFECTKSHLPSRTLWEWITSPWPSPWLPLTSSASPRWVHTSNSTCPTVGAPVSSTQPQTKQPFNPSSNHPTVSCTKYPTEACSERHFASEVQREYFSKVRLGAVQCLNAEQWLSNPPILQGTVQGMVFQYITITVSECKNSTTYNKCASKEEIKKGLSSGNYAVHLYDNLVLTGKSGSPFQEIV